MLYDIASFISLCFRPLRKRNPLLVMLELQRMNAKMTEQTFGNVLLVANHLHQSLSKAIMLGVIHLRILLITKIGEKMMTTRVTATVVVPEEAQVDQ